MDSPKQSTTSCVASMKLLGDYWTLRIIDALKYQEVRFCELQRLIDNVNPVTLTSRLKKLEEAKLITRINDGNGKVSVSYCLTERGREVLPVIKALNKFSATTHLSELTHVVR